MKRHRSLLLGLLLFLALIAPDIGQSAKTTESPSGTPLLVESTLAQMTEPEPSDTPPPSKKKQGKQEADDEDDADEDSDKEKDDDGDENEDDDES